MAWLLGSLTSFLGFSAGGWVCGMAVISSLHTAVRRSPRADHPRCPLPVVYDVSHILQREFERTESASRDIDANYWYIYFCRPYFFTNCVSV